MALTQPEYITEDEWFAITKGVSGSIGPFTARVLSTHIVVVCPHQRCITLWDRISGSGIQDWLWIIKFCPERIEEVMHSAKKGSIEPETCLEFRS